MDQIAFAESPWWIMGQIDDGATGDLRNKLGLLLGGYDREEWYLRKEKLHELFKLLEQRPSDLLTDLDHPMDGDISKQKEWLEKVIEFLEPPANNQPSGNPADQQLAQPETTKSSAPAARPVVNPKVSAFGKKAGDAPTSANEAATVASAPTDKPKSGFFAKKADAAPSAATPPTVGESITAILSDSDKVSRLLSAAGVDEDKQKAIDVEALMKEPEFERWWPRRSRSCKIPAENRHGNVTRTRREIHDVSRA
jgi:hypothetical protein